MGTRARRAVGAAADTIVAAATPPGRGGVAVVRVSGPAAARLATAVGLAGAPPPRHATFSRLHGADGRLLDEGLALFFPGPASFTGEDVLELHCHGSPQVVAELIDVLVGAGARPALPGEFSQRAFLNGKLDLTQAEAVADLIDAGTRHAAQAALRALEGQLSAAVDGIARELLALRAWTEATIDFDDEDDVNRSGHPDLERRLQALRSATIDLRRRCARGRMLREGLRVVLAGPPNAGKSSLLNALSERDAAIVTDRPGTTRDVLREAIDLDGLPLMVVDTAGLRATQDPVEQAGIDRARAQIAAADRVLYVVDAAFVPPAAAALRSARGDDLPAGVPVTVVRNKIDLTGEPPGVQPGDRGAATAAPVAEATVSVSARTGAGLDALRAHLRACAGLHEGGEADALSARARHLAALDSVIAALDAVTAQWHAGATELVAEELRAAHEALMEITGEVTTEDLLGEIFSTFCIGK